MSGDLKYTKENIELRRARVAELNAQGYNISEISRLLNVSVSLISLDMQFIRDQALAKIKEYINVKLPEEYNKCMLGLNLILKESWQLSSKTEDGREKIQALSLAKQCYDAKLDLLTNVDVVEDVIKFIDKDRTRSGSSITQPEPQQEEDSQSTDSSSETKELSRESEDHDSTNEVIEEDQDANRE